MLSRLFSSKYRLPIIAGIIFLIWLPLLIMMFPGTVVNDSWWQINHFVDFKNGGLLNDHHPIFDTYLIGGYIFLIVKIFGSFEFASFSFVILQSIATCLTLAYSIVYAHDKLKLKEKPLLIFLAIYCFLPIFPLISQTISKDAIFSWIYVLFIIQFIELVRTKGASLSKKRSLILFIVTIIFCALSKKVGIYVISGSLLCALIFLRSAWKQILGSIAALAIMMFGIMPFVLNLIGVEKGGLQEMLSLPFQQTARYAANHDDATESEISVIEKVLGRYDELPSKYVPNNADPIKGGTQRGEDGDYTKYIKTWIKQGLRHPDVYFAAAGAMWKGWFMFTEFKPAMNMDWHNLLEPDIFAGEEWTKRPEVFDNTARFVEEAYDAIYGIPVVGAIFSIGIYATWLPLGALVVMIVSRKKKAWLVFIPMGLSIGLGCLLAPVSDTGEGSRYIFPIIYSLPITFAWCVYSFQAPTKLAERKTHKK